jgi:prophage tail gpP-like protein
MGKEQIRVEVGGETFTSWESVKIRAAFDEACRSFSLKAANELGPAETHATFALGVELKIFANGDLLLDGYVDRRCPKLSEDETGITISGRSKSCDLVDCSAVHDGGDFDNMTPLEIGNAIAAGIAARFESDQVLEPVETYHLAQGKTIFTVVEELCRDQNKTLTGTAAGNVLITKAGTSRHAGGLYEGGNIIEAEADHNASNRHSKYIVRGQVATGHGAEALEIEATAADARVRRFRPLIIVQKESTSKKRAKGRAATRRDRAAGNALGSDVTVQGFRDENGAVFEPGRLIWTESETLGIAQDMLIERVEFSQGSKAGSLTELGLVDPRAYDGDKGKGNQSSDDNDLDDSEPE